MFEQLEEVGPGEREKKRKEGRDGMLDRSVTGCNHRLLISLSNRPGFVHLKANAPSTVGVVWNKKVLNSNRASKQACLCCCTHASGPDYFMVSAKYTVPSVKWRLKGAVVSPACVFLGSKVLLCGGAPFATC